MSMTRRLRFAFSTILWLQVALVALVLIGAYSLTTFFVVASISFVAVVGLTSPSTVAVEWRSTLKWPIVAALISYLIVVGQQILTFL